MTKKDETNFAPEYLTQKYEIKIPQKIYRVKLGTKHKIRDQLYTLANI